MTRTEKKIIFLSASGQIIEFYDFLTFIMLANIISSHFFVGTIYTKLIYLFGVFALGYFVRPLGGVIFGHYGDTLGRKKTFIATILLISITTFCMGLIPSYQKIGLIAPIIFIILRILQGCSVGGELPGAVSFVYEHMPDHKKTFGTSFIFSAATIGYLLASLVATILHIFLNNHQMASFGWRLAFFLGGILGLTVCILRGKISDTPVFERLLKHNQVLRYPIKQLLKKNFKNCILGIFILFFTTYGTVFMITLPNLLSTYMHYYLLKHILTVDTFSIATLIICIVIFGYIVDLFKINIYLFLAISCFFIIALICPLFILLQTQNEIWLISVYMLFAISYGMIASVEFHILAKLFPATVEYSGLGLVINIGAILSAGLIPLVTTYIFKHTKSLSDIAYALIVVCLFPTITSIILFFSPPDKETLRKLDLKIRALYNLMERCGELTNEEEAMFLKKLKELAFCTVNSKKFNNIKSSFIKGDKEFKPYEKAVCIDEGKLHNLDHNQQQKFYQQCKKLLEQNIDNPFSVIYKYKDILASNQGNKYFLYFYSQLMVLEYMRVKQNKQLTYKNINKIINNNLSFDSLKN